MCCTEKTQFPSRIREWVEIIDNSQKYRVFLWSICLLSIISRKEIRNGRHKDCLLIEMFDMAISSQTGQCSCRNALHTGERIACSGTCGRGVPVMRCLLPVVACANLAFCAVVRAQ